jgi:hypothetical protein
MNHPDDTEPDDREKALMDYMIENAKHLALATYCRESLDCALPISGHSIVFNLPD